MANYANLLATIAANIYTNGNNEVTAAMVKTAVDAMVASLGAGYQFMGVATPATTPSNPDAKQFYIASEPGTYTNFLDSGSNPLEVNGDEVAVFKGSGTTWAKETIWVTTYLQEEYNTIQTSEEIRGEATLYLDGYVLLNSGTFLTNPNTLIYGCYKLDVADIPANDICVVSQITRGQDFVACGAFDSDDNYLGTLRMVTSDDTGNRFWYGFAIPEGTAYLIFSNEKSYWNDCDIFAVKYTGIAAYIDERIGRPVYVDNDLMHSADFRKISDAIAFAGEHPNTTILVAPGTYDLITELGSAYFDNVPDVYYSGLLLGNNTTIKATGNGVTIKCQYAGLNTNVGKQLSLFNINGSCKVVGIDFIGENIRYIIHDDLPTSLFPDVVDYIVEFEGCSFNHKGSTMYDPDLSRPVAVGGGCHYNSKHIYDTCIFQSESVAGGSTDISYHNSAVCTSRVTLKDCYFINGKSFASRQFSSYTGTIDIFLSNNRFGGALNIQDVVYINAIEFGNEF